VGGPEIGAAHKSQKVGAPGPIGSAANANRQFQIVECLVQRRPRGARLVSKTKVIAPGAARRYAPADGSSTRGGSTSVRGRVRSLHTAKLQAASVPIA